MVWKYFYESKEYFFEIVGMIAQTESRIAQTVQSALAVWVRVGGSHFQKLFK